MAADDHDSDAPETSPFKKGNVVALGLSNYDCLVGQIDTVDDTWVTMAMMSWLTGEFGYRIQSFRISDIETFLIADTASEAEALELGYNVREGNDLIDTRQLAQFQNEWKEQGRRKKAALAASPAAPPQPSQLTEPTASKTKPVLADSWNRQSLEDLLSTPASPWVLKNHIREGQLGFLIAAPTVGKSTLATAWIMCILHGRPWCGNPTMTGSIIALVGEGRRGFGRRLDAFQRHYDLGPTPEDRYLEIVDFKVPLSSPKGQAEIKRLIEAIVLEKGEKPALVVIDTLSSHWADSEDSAEFGAPAMRALGDIADEFGCAVIVVHHTTKSKGRQTMPELNDCRGSGTFIGNSDFVFAMCATRDGEGAIVKGLKLKDDEAPPPMKLSRISVACGFDNDGEESTAAVFLNEARDAGAEASTSAKDPQQVERDVQSLVQAMVDLGHATKKDAVVTQAQMGVVRGRALFDIAVSRGFIENEGTERRPRYEPTAQGHRLVSVFADAPEDMSGDTGT